MDTEMTDVAKLSTKNLSLAERRLCRAQTTLLQRDWRAEDATPTIFEVAKTFCRPGVSPLKTYQAASCLKEGQLREIVQLLIFSDPEAAPTIIRLLTIMDGLPGNWELAMQFLERLTPEICNLLPTRFFSLLAKLGGRKTFSLCDWSAVIERAFKNNETESRWAFTTLSEHVWRGQKEAVLRVFEWETELPYELEPSIWREIQWASYARYLCVSGDVVNMDATDIVIHDTVEPETTANFVEYLPSEFGEAASHYVRIGGSLLRKRMTGNAYEPRNGLDQSPSPENKISQDQPVVLTPSIRHTVHEMASYLSYGVPFILEGPTGCGKTAILSYLAQITSYEQDIQSQCSHAPGVTFIQMDSAMMQADGESFSSQIGSVVPIPEGGGFRWRPGPIGAAVERGDWILFENIGRSTGRMSSAMSIIRKLANAKPGDKLEAPGRGEPITVGKGFRCVATRTLSWEEEEDSWEPPGGWETWCRVTMREISVDEKVQILSRRFVQIPDCIPRVVDITEKVAKYTERLRGPLFRTPTLREAVRICRRLDYLKRYSGSLTIENAFLETMDVLVAWCSSQEHFHKLSDIVALGWSLSPTVGADMYASHRPELDKANDTVKIGRARAQSSTARRIELSRLSLTGYTLRLLERTLRCLELGEPVLLSGETGAGKTAVIQELASLLGKKLVVVNLSRQSELDDLIGGFRPVDAEIAVPLLAKRFESAFCQCMSRQKNAAFLDALQKASRSAKHHTRALRLMEGAMSAIPKSSKQRSKGLRQEWASITSDLRKLAISDTPVYLSDTHSVPGTLPIRNEGLGEPLRKRPRFSRMSDQPTSKAKTSRKIDFEFADGVLVKAMREGDWILLDELNLAPPELLEQLVSILEVGRVTLADEHGSEVMKQDGFALFGAMNPPTDTGKRPVPSVLRTRFTEIHVGDMLHKDDLLDLIAHKFITCSSKNDLNRLSHAETEIARDAAEFYLRSYQMAKEGLIEDSTGKPVRFSLRSLSRMLDFASGLMGFLKSGEQEKRRALFEGALTAFGTQLPRKSRVQIHKLVETSFLQRLSGPAFRKRRLQDLLSVPRSSPVAVRVLHGFPVELTNSKDGNKLKSRGCFIVTPAVEKTLTDVCRALVVGAPKLPILLQGPTAAGKTSLVNYLAEQTGNRLVRINNHEHTELSEYFGRYVATEDGSLVFSEGPLVRAARRGYWVMLDELNLAPSDVLESLNRLLDDNREIFIPETAEILKAAPGFRLFATQNPPGLYGGRKELSRAFRSRFIEVQVDELPDNDLHTILERRAEIPTSFARRMVAVMRNLQLQRSSSGLFSGREGYITARDLFRWAARGPRSRDELAIHGFMLLAERARTPSERSLIRDVLCKEVGVSQKLLADEDLYDCLVPSDGNDSASKQCLDLSLQKLSLNRDRILRALNERGIVLTPSMRRMLVLLIHSTANTEPVLLVGATGGGKTSSCAAISSALSRQLLTVNCHRHTDASDVLGGFRPVRENKSSAALFEWVDGPLVEGMKRGSWILIDEINMADDAVVERLNPVLEVERTILLTEKGASKVSGSPDVIVAEEKFRVLATMNPGGDFGKKELSPALRNRFTELWIPPSCCIDDYLPIIEQRLGYPPYSSEQWGLTSSLVQEFVKSSLQDFQDEPDGLERDSPSLQVSIRDLSAWCEFIVDAPKVCEVDPLLAAVHGSRLIFLDGLSVGLASNHSTKLESKIWNRILDQIPQRMRKLAEKARYDGEIGIAVEHVAQFAEGDRLKVGTFFVPRNRNRSHNLLSELTSAFSFKAPSTIRNSARIARAMCVGHRPVLLEGPPGCGKSSLIAAVASVSGFEYSRINLSEGTEMSDLVGCDAPGTVQGNFVFRRGPLLEALIKGGWILLDELNLASQSVLEGLNSVLDHRKTLFVPELNEEFKAHPSFRLFGAQNSAVDGGGRRGLPKSFLNRFTRVRVEAPGNEDFKLIISSTHPHLPSKLVSQIIECLYNLRDFPTDTVSSKRRFGLRDALRWCDVISALNTGGKLSVTEAFSCTQLYACFDVVVLRGLRACDRESAAACFEHIFGQPGDTLRTTPPIRVCQGRGFRVGLGQVESLDEYCVEKDIGSTWVPLLATRSWELQALSLAMNASWPVTLFSPSPATARFETRRIVEQIATLFGKKVSVFDGASLTDAEDFVGGYVQHDAVASMRKIVTVCQDIMLRDTHNSNEKSESGDEGISAEIYAYHTRLRKTLEEVLGSENNMRSSLHEFLDSVESIIRALGKSSSVQERSKASLDELEELHSSLADFEESLDTANHAPFKWRKSDLMLAIERGEWIFLEDADACSPALLDRLNPIFERAPIAFEDNAGKNHSMTLSPTILAEAPSNEDGSPVFLRPHPNFRMFFSISKPVLDIAQIGLSKALLDRSLKLCIEGSFSDHDSCALVRLGGLPVEHRFQYTPEAPRGGVGSMLLDAITDEQTVADRTRLLCAMDDVSIKSRGSVTDQGTLSLRNSSHCVSKFSHSLNDWPCTTVGEFVDNPDLSLIERDVASIRLLEHTSEEVFLEFTNEVRQFLVSSIGGMQTVLLDEENGHALTIEGARRHILLASANTFLLGCTSCEDLARRASILRERASRCTGSLVCRIYTDRASIAIQNSTHSGSFFSHSGGTKSRLCSLGVPLDPLFSFDCSSQHLPMDSEGIDLQYVKYTGKRLRSDLLALQLFRRSCHDAEKGAHNENFFGRAKVAFNLARHKRAATADGSPLDIIAYDIIRSAQTSIDPFDHLIKENEEWEVDKEEEWMNFFRLASRLCELMIADEEPTRGSLTAVIYSIASTLSDIKERSHPCFQGLLEDLHRRLQVFSEEIEATILVSNKRAMPRSELGQDVEADFLRSVTSTNRRVLTATQINTVVNGLATLAMQDLAASNGLLHELGKVAGLVKERASSNLDEGKSLDHWSRITHQRSVQMMNQAVLTIRTDENAQEPPSSQWNCALQIVNTCQDSIMYSPYISLNSLVSMQKLKWILESFRTPRSESSPMTSSLSEILSLVSLCLLDEFNSLFRTECKRQRGQTGKLRTGIGSFSSTLFMAASSASIPFWSLSDVCAEAACAASTIAGGGHRVDYTNSFSNALFRKNAHREEPHNSVLANDDSKPFDTFTSSSTSKRGPDTLMALETGLVECTASDSKDISKPERVMQLGKAWVAAGIANLDYYHAVIKRCNGLDPSQFSSCMRSFASNNILLTSLSSSVYKVYSTHRLGGDCFSGSIPDARVTRTTKKFLELLTESMRNNTFRPSRKNTFEMYESFVHKVHATIVTQIIGTSLLANLNLRQTPKTRARVAEEVVHLSKSCEALSRELRCDGSFGHFRDVSTVLALGLQEVQYGLHLTRKAFELYSASHSPELERHSSFVSDILLFPRAAYEQAINQVDSVKVSKDMPISGECIMALSGYLIECNSHMAAHHCSNGPSKVLSEIVLEWKNRTLADEKEIEAKESLHILREVGRKQMIPGSEIAEQLVVDEDSDYIRTFNPISQEEEEELYGVISSEAMQTDRKSKGFNENDGESPGRKISPESFWALHRKVYPSVVEVQSNAARVRERAQHLSSLSSHLFFLTSDIHSSIDELPSVWETFAADSVAQAYSVSFSHEQEKKDEVFRTRSSRRTNNFYTDPNVEELTKASLVLKNLKNTVHTVQERFFKDTGNHPVLDEVDLAISRIANACKVGSPLSRIVLGLENVLRKADEWHRLFATSETRLDRQVMEVSRLVARWRRLEVESWPLLLQSRVIACGNRACRWAFLLYDAIVHEGIRSINSDPESMKDVAGAVDQFLRSSPCGEFEMRLDMVVSLGRHVLSFQTNGTEFTKKLGWCLLGLGGYYGLFLASVRRDIGEKKRSIDKELTEFTKLVSWNAPEDLGSSCKMSKEKDKYLQYFRLKNAAEKTRRKLHKLCLKVDEILRTPVYESLSRQLSNIGFSNSFGQITTPGMGTSIENSVSERVRCANDLLFKEMTPLTKHVPTMTPQNSSSGSGSLLSRVPHLERKLESLKRDVYGLGKMKCELASEFSIQLRSMIRGRIDELRNVNIAHIQVKRRALAELFKALHRAGISPFESSFPLESHRWLSEPNPTTCAEYNALANELFWKSALQNQRLREVSDSRHRNAEIPNEDAVKFRAFSQCMFESACAQRRSLNEIFVCFRNLSSEVAVLNRMKINNNIPPKVQAENLHAQKLKQVFARLNDIFIDLLASEIVFKRMLKRARDTMTKFQGSTDQTGFLIKNTSSDSIKGLDVLDSLFQSAIASIKEIVTSKMLTPLDGKRGFEYGLADASFAEAHDWAKTALSRLSEDLDRICLRAKKVSPDNFVFLLLTPIQSFLHEALSHSTAKTGKEREACHVPSLLSQMNEDATTIIETVLTSSQRILAWNDLSVTSSGLQNKNENALCEKYTIRDLEERGLMKTASMRVTTLSSAVKLPEITTILCRNKDVVRRLLQMDASSEKITEALHLQKVLARFVGEYLDNLVLPSLLKCSQFHLHSLRLLQNLSSVFIGLCGEGFCRPPEEDEMEAVENETEGRVGGGFGDAGEGDMSSAQNVSDQIEDEEQLLGLQENVQDDSETPEPQKNDERDEDGVDMTTDFDGDLQDYKNEEEEANIDEDAEKEMAPETGTGDNIIDQRIWGDDGEQQSPDESMEKDKKAEESGTAARESSELVAKNDGHKDDKASDPNQTSHERIDDSNSEKEDDVKGEEQGECSDGDDDKMTGSQQMTQKKNPFDASNDEELTADEENMCTPNNPSHSEELPPEHDDNSGTQKQDVMTVDLDEGNSPELDDTTRGGSTQEEGEDRPMSDLDDGNKGEEDPMFGVEQDEERQEGEKDGIEDSLMETSDIPDELNLQDDIGSNDQAEEESEHRPSGTIDENSSQPEADPMNEEVETGEDYNRTVEENDDSDEAHSKSVEKNAGKSSMETQYEPSIQGGKGRGTNNEESQEQSDEYSTLKDQRNDADVYDDRDRKPQGARNDMSSEVAGSDLPGFETSYEENGAGEFRERGELNKSEAKYNELDCNPLRISRPEELVEVWKQHLKVIENEDHTNDAKPEPQQPSDRDGLWEYKNDNDNEGPDNEMHALGPATEDQQRPLHELEDEGSSPQDEMKEENSSDVKGRTEQLPPSADVNSRMNMRNGQNQDEKDFDADVHDVGQEGDETYVKPHPAHKAVEGSQEKSREPAQKEVNLNEIVDEKHSTAEEENISREGEAPSQSNARVAWKTECLDTKLATELWHRLDNKVSSGSAVLCEQLRLVLEPTEASGLSGGYRTGKRLNMRKVIEYVASDFQKDRIWLRRVKPDKRSYDIMVAIDDSASMAESEAGTMAVESLALVLSALSRLEIGRVGVARFGVDADMVRDFDEPLPMAVERGAQLLQQFSFSQEHTDVVKLLHFIHSKMGRNVDPGNVEHVSLAFVISDGRLSDRDEVRRQLRHLKNSNVLIAFVILDQVIGDQPSIYDVKRVDYDKEGNLSISPYMKDFPVEFYTTVRDVRSLPSVLADALRQWIEATNS